MSEPAEPAHSAVRRPDPHPERKPSRDGMKGERSGEHGGTATGEDATGHTPHEDTDRQATSSHQVVTQGHCGWCGRRLETGRTVGRRRRYCGQACRQRAYERRAVVQRSGIPADAVVLAAGEIAALQDRLFQLRCAAEDVVTAVDEGAPPADLRRLADAVARSAHDLERLR